MIRRDGRDVMTSSCLPVMVWRPSPGRGLLLGYMLDVSITPPAPSGLGHHLVQLQSGKITGFSDDSFKYKLNLNHNVEVDFDQSAFVVSEQWLFNAISKANITFMERKLH